LTVLCLVRSDADIAVNESQGHGIVLSAPFISVHFRQSSVQ